MEIANVYITPPAGGGGEFPDPIPFRLGSGHYTKKFVRAYAGDCTSRVGQTVRIVWPNGKQEVHRPWKK